MRTIEREDLRIGYVISYSFPNTGQVSYGTIVHLGLGRLLVTPYGFDARMDTTRAMSSVLCLSM